MVSESFIHALLLFLGLFLKISSWVPLIWRETSSSVAKCLLFSQVKIVHSFEKLLCQVYKRSLK